ncbi:hypothetical protein D3C73_943330 [compost metagenome]
MQLGNPRRYFLEQLGIDDIPHIGNYDILLNPGSRTVRAHLQLVAEALAAQNGRILTEHLGEAQSWPAQQRLRNGLIYCTVCAFRRLNQQPLRNPFNQQSGMSE